MAEILISFDNNRLLPQLLGEQDKNLTKIENLLDVNASSRGNMISITGSKKNISISEAILRRLYKKLEKGADVEDAEFDAMIRMESESQNKTRNGKANGEHNSTDIAIKTLKKSITLIPGNRLNT